MDQNIDAVISYIKSNSELSKNLEFHRIEVEREGNTQNFPAAICPILIEELKNSGIKSLFTHQAETISLILENKNVVLATGTASGKSLCYQIPIAEKHYRNSSTTSLLLVPTKALAQDQEKAINKIFSSVITGIYDGDTSAYKRSAIKNRANLIITNPDMLHVGILPHHTRWESFFKNLELIVVDEAHIYRGIFGSHLANLIRRLKRICRFYGSRPTFMITSATIGNPCEFAQRLIGEPVILVNNDGSPKGRRDFFLYNPPIVHQELGIRKSAINESAFIADTLLNYNLQSIIFTRSRKTLERLLSTIREKSGNELSIRGYRSGYLPSKRREIEKSLKSGDTKLVVATNALELGVDIGEMEAVLMVGYPGSIAAANQQAGRAGRRNNASLAMLVASAGLIDQFIMRHPGYLFDNSPENALIDPNNLLILLQHLRCAVFELPFSPNESFGELPQDQINSLLDILVVKGELLNRSGKYYWIADQYPSSQTSLRSGSGDIINLLLEEEEQFTVIGNIEKSSAAWMVHPGAIYIHEATTYQVEDLNFEDKKAVLKKLDVDYLTEPKSETQVTKLDIQRQIVGNGWIKYFGEIQVRTQVVGYKLFKKDTYEQLSYYPLTMPPENLRTVGFWIDLTQVLVERLRQQNQWGNDPNDYGSNWNRQRELARKRDNYRCRVCGIVEGDLNHHVHHIRPLRMFSSSHEANALDNLITLCPRCHQRAEFVVKIQSGLSGLSYLAHHMAPFYLMCDIRDIGVYHDPFAQKDETTTALLFFDRVPGGIGLSSKLFELSDRLLKDCGDLVSACLCMDGCPSCVGPAAENGVGGKKQVIGLLEQLI